MPLDKNRKYPIVVISSYVFFIRDNKILLSRRYKTGYHDGDYSLPAGHIEEKEFASEAAIREILEEVGVSIGPKNIIPYIRTAIEKWSGGNFYSEFTEE